MIIPREINNPTIELRLLSAIALRGKFTDNNTVVLDNQDWYILTDKQVEDVLKMRAYGIKQTKVSQKKTQKTGGKKEK